MELLFLLCLQLWYPEDAISLAASEDCTAVRLTLQQMAMMP